MHHARRAGAVRCRISLESLVEQVPGRCQLWDRRVRASLTLPIGVVEQKPIGRLAWGEEEHVCPWSAGREGAGGMEQSGGMGDVQPRREQSWMGEGGGGGAAEWEGEGRWPALQLGSKPLIGWKCGVRVKGHRA